VRDGFCVKHYSEAVNINGFVPPITRAVERGGGPLTKIRGVAQW
jgi:hypothetical protein